MVITIGFDVGANGEWYSSEIFQVVTQSAVCIMVWGCISIHNVGNLVVVDGNLDAEGYISIQDTNLPETVENMFVNHTHPFKFQQDNAPYHTAGSMETWLYNEGILKMQWPAQSSDVNPIENLWNNIAKTIMRDHPMNRQELLMSIFHAWAAITLIMFRLFMALCQGEQQP